jgi:secreted Zn-dependent insulinase-like peptidase
MAAHVSESNVQDLETGAYLSLIDQIINQKFYNELRTKQQLGYFVQAMKTFDMRRAALRFIIQSEVPTNLLEKQILEFINKIPEMIDKISNDDFKNYVSAISNLYGQKPKTPFAAFNEHVNEITERRFDFQRKRRISSAVEQITKEKLIRYAIERVVNAPKIVSIVTGSGERDVVTSPQDEINRIKSNPQVQWVYTNYKPLEKY